MATRTLRIGSLVRTLEGDEDCDDNDERRTVPPGSIGRVTSVDVYSDGPEGEKFGHSVVFANGCWVILHESELGDPTKYEVVLEYPATPELTKMKGVKEELGIDHVAAFLEWCQEKGMELGEAYSPCNPDLKAVNWTIERILAEYAGVDLQKVSEEKDAVYRFLVESNEILKERGT